MDAHGQIGPEKGDYAADVVAVARKLREGTTYVDLAHNGTKYRLLLTLREDVDRLGDYGIEGVPAGQGFIHVAATDHGHYWFQLGGYIAPSYVADKLDDFNETDGKTIAEFLKRLELALTNNGQEVVA